MTKISEALTYGLTIRESATDGSDFTNPTADYRRLFLGEDGSLHLRDSSGTVTAVGGGIADQGAFTYLDATEASPPGTPASGKVRLYAKSDGRIYSKDDAGVEYGPFDEAGGGAGTVYDDDFSAATLDAKWTELGGSLLDTLNTTDVSGQLHMAETAIGYAVCGVYQTAPGGSYVVVAKVASWTLGSNYVQAALMFADATPTALRLFGPLYGGYGGAVNDLSYGVWSSRTARTSASDTNISMSAPLWLMAVVLGSTVSFHYSTDGTTWAASYAGVSLGFTPSYIGLAIAGNTSGGDASAHWEEFAVGIIPTI